MMKVENMVSERSGREVANQFIIRDDNKIVFQSYNSIIAVIDNSKTGADRLTLGCDWDYSNTTMKYLNKFLRDFFGWSGACAKAIRAALENGEIAYNPQLV